MLLKYRAILFDAGGTLLFLDYPRLAAAVQEACAAGPGPQALRDAASAAALELERQGGSEGERAARYLRALFLHAGLDPSRWETAQSALYDAHRERHLWSGGAADTATALTRLRAAGIRLGVVSNSDGRVAHALEAAGLARYFDVIVDSRVAGVEKPDPRIFHIALEQLDVAPGDALYVGDVYEVDVVGARNAGLAAALVGAADAGDMPGVVRADTVADLVNVLLGASTS